jgi:hypothetical protein
MFSINDTMKQLLPYPKIRLGPLFLALVLIRLAGPAVGADFYVDSRMPNSGDGHSLQSAFKTIGEAAALMQAGDTCFIRAGIYRETVVPARSGSPGRPLVLTSYANEPVTVSGTDSAGRFIGTTFIKKPWPCL